MNYSVQWNLKGLSQGTINWPLKTGFISISSECLVPRDKKKLMLWNGDCYY